MNKSESWVCPKGDYSSIKYDDVCDHMKSSGHGNCSSTTGSSNSSSEAWQGLFSSLFKGKSSEEKLALNHSIANELNDKAIELQKKGEYISAVKYFQKAYQRWPENSIIKKNLELAVELIPGINERPTRDVSSKDFYKIKLKTISIWIEPSSDQESKNIIARLEESNKLSREASELIKEQNFIQAYRKLNEAMQVDPDHKDQIQNLVNEIKQLHITKLISNAVELATTDYESALANLAEAQHLDPKNPETTNTLKLLKANELVKQAIIAKSIDANEIALSKLNFALQLLTSASGSDAYNQITELIQNTKGEIEKMNEIKEKLKGHNIEFIEGPAISDLVGLEKKASDLKKEQKSDLELKSKSEFTKGINARISGAKISTPEGRPIDLRSNISNEQYQVLQEKIKAINSEIQIKRREYIQMDAKLQLLQNKILTSTDLNESVAEAKAIKQSILSKVGEIETKKEQIRNFYMEKLK